jgi:asparagine synthase (glutamine-hydrolysing)
MTDDLLSESIIKRRGLFRPESIQKLMREHRSGTRDWSMQIWQFLTLELWTQSFVDGAADFSAEESMRAAIA